MSLESRLESLEAAVVKLTEAILSQPPGKNAGASAEAPPSSKKRGRRAAASSKKDQAPAPEPAGPSDEERLKALQDVTLKTVEVAGRDATVAVLAKFGVKKASELPPAQYDEVQAALEAAQAAATDDLT